MSFFQRDNVKAFLKAALAILKLVARDTAGNLQIIAQEEVNKAEQAGKSGQEKYETAYKAVKKRFPELRESAINLAIELSVSTLQAAQG